MNHFFKDTTNSYNPYDNLAHGGLYSTKILPGEQFVPNRLQVRPATFVTGVVRLRS